MTRELSVVETPCSVFQDGGGWALDFQWKSEGLLDGVLGFRKGVRAKAEPVGPEQGLGRAQSQQ